MFRQEQVILRSLPPPSSLAADSAKLWWTWRKTNKNASTRSLAHTLAATVCAAGFIAIGILSSNVVSTSDLEVLVDSSHCGLFNATRAELASVRTQPAQVVALATPYAAECYDDHKVVPARCRAFVNPRVSFSTERVACPFSPEYCTGTIFNDSALLPAVAFDSGLIDVNRAFGMNLPKNEAISYRRRNTCTVLPLQGHETVLDAKLLPKEFLIAELAENSSAVILSYGRQPGLGQWENLTSSYISTTVSRSKQFTIT